MTPNVGSRANRQLSSKLHESLSRSFKKQNITGPQLADSLKSADSESRECNSIISKLSNANSNDLGPINEIESENENSANKDLNAKDKVFKLKQIGPQLRIPFTDKASLKTISRIGVKKSANDCIEDEKELRKELGDD
jgi:hypothetical protein